MLVRRAITIKKPEMTIPREDDVFIDTLCATLRDLIDGLHTGHAKALLDRESSELRHYDAIRASARSEAVLQRQSNVGVRFKRTDIEGIGYPE
ncbi:hypothetical protein [Caballeronia sp. J97]|uniref:hypothetical protein n=1 Tax=Caballeronia sp. J97 TaxID=2805429 RepID=UPI002AAF294A|nr:hypothetical protein [Caballeronia sp. J97]